MTHKVHVALRAYQRCAGKETDLRSVDSPRSVSKTFIIARVGNHEQLIRLSDGLFAEVRHPGRLVGINAVLGFEALPAVIDQADQGNRRVANQCCEVGDVVIGLFRHDIH